MTYTVIGNLTGQPELQHTPNGTPVTRARVACNPTTRRADGTLSKLETVFHDVQLWRQHAERFSELPMGTAVVIVGDFRSSTYTTAEGQKRTRTYLHATAGGPDLARMSVTGVTRPKSTAGDTGTAQESTAATQGTGIATTSTMPVEQDEATFDIDAVFDN